MSAPDRERAEPTVARHALVKGRVQGVAFRWHTCEEARRLRLAGFVKNRADGSVEVWIEGAPERVDELVAWLRRGPPAARVTGLELREREPSGHAAFDVRPSD